MPCAARTCAAEPSRPAAEPGQPAFVIGEVGDGDEVVFGPGGDDANLRSGLSSGFDGRDDSGGFIGPGDLSIEGRVFQRHLHARGRHLHVTALFGDLRCAVEL